MRRLVVISVIVFAAALQLRAQVYTSRVTKILADARQALGGAAKLDAVKTFVLKGNVIAISSGRGGHDLRETSTFEISCELPDKFIRRDDRGYSDAGDMLSASPWDGAGWPQESFSRPRTTHFASKIGFNSGRVIYDSGDLSGDAYINYTRQNATQAQLQRYLPQAQLDFVQVTLGMFARTFASVPLSFYETKGTEDGSAISVFGDRWVTMNFDPMTHLPLSLGTLQYMDYRDVAGVKVPFNIGQMVLYHDGKKTTTAFRGLEIKSVKINVPIGAGTFK